MSRPRIGSTSLSVRAMPGPDGWRIEHLIRGCVYAMTPEEAEATGRALIAAVSEAKARTDAELVLPLTERVRLCLARLCYLPPHRIAKDLGADETSVRDALNTLVTAGRVRSLAPTYPDLYEAVDRSGARPEEG